jgi:hypothetical protein
VPAETRDDILGAASLDLARDVARVRRKHGLSPLETLWVLNALSGGSLQGFLKAERAVIRGPKSGKPGDV